MRLLVPAVHVHATPGDHHERGVGRYNVCSPFTLDTLEMRLHGVLFADHNHEWLMGTAAGASREAFFER